MGAADLLERAEHFDSVGDAVGDCGLVVGTTAVRHRNVQHTLRRSEDGARLIRKRLAAVDGKRRAPQATPSQRSAVQMGHPDFGASGWRGDFIWVGEGWIIE